MMGSTDIGPQKLIQQPGSVPNDRNSAFACVPRNYLQKCVYTDARLVSERDAQSFTNQTKISAFKEP